jgi:hypothetical protein
MELRCENRLQGVLRPDGKLEIKCRDRYCGAASGFVVLHTFDVETGKLLYTERFKDPIRRNE